MTEHLYTTADVKRVREHLAKEQRNLDAITGLEIPKGQAVLDHCHKSQMVRAVLHRQTNAYLGKLENNFTRYIGYWYDGTLSDFLRQVADYLETPSDERFVHPRWLKKCMTEFNKLNAEGQIFVLKPITNNLKNSVERKKEFQKHLLKRIDGFRDIMLLLNKYKDSNANN